MCIQKTQQQTTVARLKLFGRLIAFPLFAILGYIPLAMGWPSEHWLCQTLLVGLLTYSWFCIGGLSHELIHGNLKTPSWLQHAVAHSIGTFIAVPLTVYRESHMRHHAYLNTPLDSELWPYSSPKTSLAFRRVFVWLDVVFGVFTAPLIYASVCFQKERPLRPNVLRRVLIEYLAVVLFWSTLSVLFVLGVTSGTIELSPRLLIYAAPLAIASSMNSVRKLTEHLGMSHYDPVLGTRTLVAGNPFVRLLSYFNFDLAIHGPHHRHPRLPHTELGAKMDELRAARPGELPVYHSLSALLLTTLDCMIRNPGVGVNAGGHASFGRLPGLPEDTQGECLVVTKPTHDRAA